MDKKITVIVVNPFTQTVEEKEIKENEVANEVGQSPLTAIYFEDHIMFLDDEGLYKKDNRFFSIEFEDAKRYINDAFCGIGVIAKGNDEGDTISATLSADEVRDNITWKSEDYKESFTVRADFKDGWVFR